MAQGSQLMMVLIDTTVWIDFFAGRQLPHVAVLESLIKKREDICICGIILTEVLQGIRDINEFRKTQELFNFMIFLPMPYSVFLGAAKIYRNLRRKGITIRNSVDCMKPFIQEFCIRNIHAFRSNFSLLAANGK